MAKASNFIDVRRILSIQMDHFVTKDKLWYCLTLIQAYAFFRFAPDNANMIFPELAKCVVPNLDKDGGVIGMNLVRIPKEEQTQSCFFLPDDMKLTET